MIFDKATVEIKKFQLPKEKLEKQLNGSNLVLQQQEKQLQDKSKSLENLKMI